MFIFYIRDIQFKLQSIYQLANFKGDKQEGDMQIHAYVQDF